MSGRWLAGVPALLLVFVQWETLGAAVPITTPMMDQFVAINSDENVTYSCSLTDTTSVVVWEVERSQIRNADQFQQLVDIGIIIEPMNTVNNMSAITITRTARVMNNFQAFMIQCLANQGISSIEGERYSVITFVAPTAVENLALLPSLTLEWTRPSQPAFTQEQVPISYTIESNATDGSGMNFRNFTSETSFSVQFLEDMLRDLGSECVEFEFFVFATNDAGSGPLMREMDTVPISPDVTVINNEFRVERVDLQALTVDLSFPPVQPCSVNFPLHNYTINIDGSVALVLTPDRVMAGVPLTGLQLAGLSQDNSFSVTVMACNNVTCRTSDANTLNTTDVQAAQAVFFENRLFLQCSFADNSRARGCVFRLVLVGSNETERFEVPRQGSTGSMCTTANNQREVYSSVFVLDWEENGMEGNLPLNITSVVRNVSSLAEYTEATGCVETSNPAAAIVGGIFGALTGLLIIAVVVVLVALFFVHRKKKHVEPTVVEKLIFSTLERKKKHGVITPAAETEPLMFECDVTADDECANKIKDDLLAAQRQTSITSDAATEASAAGDFSLISMADVEKDKHAWIEGHDDPEQPLTIKVKWKPLIQSLIAVNSLRPDTKPLLAEGKDLSKVKVRLDMS